MFAANHSVIVERGGKRPDRGRACHRHSLSSTNTQLKEKMVMSKLDIIRAWKDEEYCESLSAADRLRIPQNPAGVIELTEQDMGDVEGGTITFDPLLCGSFI